MARKLRKWVKRRGNRRYNVTGKVNGRGRKRRDELFGLDLLSLACTFMSARAYLKRA